MGWVGLGGSFIGAFYTKMKVKSYFNEQSSKWTQNLKIQRFLGGWFQADDWNDFSQRDGEFILDYIDPKKWKSTLSALVALVAGLAVSSWAITKMCGPRRNEAAASINPLLDEGETTPKPAKSWQDDVTQRATLQAMPQR